jgi:hypothetical protein
MFRLPRADGLDLRLSLTARGQYIGGPCVARHVPGVTEMNRANCGLTSSSDPFGGSSKRPRGPRRIRGLEGRIESELGPAASQDVAVEKPSPARETLAVDERPVPRQPVVHDRPIVREAGQLRVHARDVRVPRERDVGAHAPPDRHPVPGVGEREHTLAIAGIWVHEVGIASPPRLREVRSLLGCELAPGHGPYWTTASAAVQGHRPAHGREDPPNVPAQRRLESTFTGSGLP